MEINISPAGFECKIEQCPPGFFLYQGMIGFKSEYGDYYCDSGEFFHGKNPDKVNSVKVIPVSIEVVEDDGDE